MDDQDLIKSLQIQIEILCQRNDELKTAIRKHRDAKGHDRCWENDLELYKVLGEPLPQQELPPMAEFKQRCHEYMCGQYKGSSNEANA